MAKILLFRGVTIAPSPEREPLPIERKARALALRQPETAAKVEAFIDELLRHADDRPDDGGRHAS